MKWRSLFGWFVCYIIFMGRIRSPTSKVFIWKECRIHPAFYHFRMNLHFLKCTMYFGIQTSIRIWQQAFKLHENCSISIKNIKLFFSKIIILHKKNHKTKYEMLPSVLHFPANQPAEVFLIMLPKHSTPKKRCKSLLLNLRAKFSESFLHEELSEKFQCVTPSFLQFYWCMASLAYTQLLRLMLIISFRFERSKRIRPICVANMYIIELKEDS